MAGVVWKATEVEKEIENDMINRLRQAAVLVRDAAKQNVSVSSDPHKFRDKTYRPGSLKKSIKYKINRKKLTARVGTDIIYGIFQEIGPVMKTRQVARKKSIYTAKNRWRHKPYLRPALHTEQSRLQDILGVTTNAVSHKEIKPSSVLL